MRRGRRIRRQAVNGKEADIGNFMIGRPRPRLNEVPDR